MITSAFITPHSPILIPNIGKKNTSILKRSSDALLEIKNKIKNEKIDTIIVFSPHNKRKNSEIEINSHFQYDLNFEKFGDYFSRLSFSGDIELAYKIKETVEKEIKTELYSDSKVDYGAAIPLYLLLSEENQKIISFKGKVLAINSSLQKNIEHHFNFGQKISELLNEENKNIILIASAELSHCLSHRAPGGFYQKAESFDNRVIESLKKNQEGVGDLLSINEKTRLEAKECGLRPVAMLLGAINKLNYQAETLSYQKDLGIGYLTMDMNL
ncbi:AmmeMemoRadiSam system protein B [Candidatus Falkowbacteria bacterium HGW-Falkowbacteria-1]|uniref:AmmeMemoRadiSam system protein B n=1 Tax=Candidatus Falkowbacteria bacterium HGW-Falkowbacteria-1 TaxID=2013768 RepID=A0A2N2EA95_9BACT|nr:MAG: AmmeMemoRadiSam system protein B [Candidatus Falkowbacteria bacterium HGW-Falkowbacteria-1]